MTASFDYVIVGSGPEGCVLADRLTEDGKTTVCVLEAGIPDRSIYIRIPAGFVKTLYDPAFTWGFHCEPGPGIAGREIRLPQGRLVGGSSSVNGLVYNRGQAEDFDDWEALGNAGWGYRDVLPYFRRSERKVGPGDDQYRGRHGALPVTDPDWPSPLCDAFIRGAGELGIPPNPDYNGAVQEGAGYFQRTIHKGRRVSAADAFLHPAVRRGNVALWTGAEATGIDLEGRRATGVRYRRGGAENTVFARREVILCAGTVNSPKLLQLSGIGPAALLREAGVETMLDLPGVGENLRDHYTVRIVARAKNARTINEVSRGWRLGGEVLKWLAGRPSILALSPSLVHVFCKSQPELQRTDTQVLFTPASYQEGKVYVLDEHPGMSCGARSQRPYSTGWVRIQSADPKADPFLQPNYMTHEADQTGMVVALKLARRLLQTDSMRPYLDQETLPGAQVSSEDEWLDYARQRGGTGYHVVGTCSMGPAVNPQAVVGADLRVHGIEALRVVDASVMPLLPSANTLAATLMIAEKAADAIRELTP
jgi:choline dehydrogenase